MCDPAVRCDVERDGWIRMSIVQPCGADAHCTPHRFHEFELGDVQPLPWNRPVATFTAKGEFYYIDVYRCVDGALVDV